MPESRYARRGTISIADEVVGEGPIDLVLGETLAHIADAIATRHA